MKSFDGFVCETTYFYEKARIIGRSHKSGLYASGHNPYISGHKKQFIGMVYNHNWQIFS
jgi:hypothetical protein